MYGYLKFVKLVQKLIGRKKLKDNSFGSIEPCQPEQLPNSELTVDDIPSPHIYANTNVVCRPLSTNGFVDLKKINPFTGYVEIIRELI